MQRLVVAVVALVLGSLTSAPSPEEASACVAVIAHRGASSMAPENTLRAITRAAARGVQRVEIDVRQTADGRFVLMHDASLARTTDVEQRFPADDPWLVAQTPYAKVKSLDAGSWKDGRYAEVPTVSSVLATGAPLLLEPKVPVEYRRVKRWASSGDVIVQTFNVEWARGLAEEYPEIPLWIVRGRALTEAEILDWSRWADGVAVRHRMLDAATVAALHDAGMTVAAWTVNREEAAKSLVAMGVDSIITDRVGATKKWVGC